MHCFPVKCTVIMTLLDVILTLIWCYCGVVWHLLLHFLWSADDILMFVDTSFWASFMTHKNWLKINMIFDVIMNFYYLIRFTLIWCYFDVISKITGKIFRLFFDFSLFYLIRFTSIWCHFFDVILMLFWCHMWCYFDVKMMLFWCYFESFFY